MVHGRDTRRVQLREGSGVVRTSCRNFELTAGVQGPVGRTSQGREEPTNPRCGGLSAPTQPPRPSVAQADLTFAAWDMQEVLRDCSCQMSQLPYPT
jgi:hypothetical protein